MEMERRDLRNNVLDYGNKKEYAENLEENIKDIVIRLKNKAYKPALALRGYIPKDNGKMRPLGISIYEYKIVQLALKKILEAYYEALKERMSKFGLELESSKSKIIKFGKYAEQSRKQLGEGKLHVRFCIGACVVRHLSTKL